VPSRFGAAEKEGGDPVLQPALALDGDVVFFSPDAKLVDRALDVAAKRYPAVADSFADAAGETLAFVSPGALVELLRQETFAALPGDEKDALRNAADVYLRPRFDALARYPAQRARLAPGNGGGDAFHWRALTWETATR